MIDIPGDVWLHIAEFIPEEDLWGMITVNSVFFNLGMDVRYREVCLCGLDFVDKKLRRLLDPAVAKRVRHLRIEPHGQGVVSTCERESFWKRGIDVVLRRVRDFPAMQKPAQGSGATRPGAMEELEQNLIEVVSCLTNVTNFTADMLNLSSAQHLQPFLAAAWSAFGSNLRSLSLEGNLESMRTLVASSTQLGVLRELRLEFTSRANGDVIADMRNLVDVLAPFVNTLSPTLQDLTIISWAAGASIDLSSFFLRLGKFLVLQQFSIRVPFNKAFHHDPSGFTCFLRDQSQTLKSVILRLNPSRSMVDPSEEESLSQWMTQLTSDNLVLANLHSFQMYPSVREAGFNAFIVCLRRSADTLTTLTVRDRYLTFDEVDAVISTFLHRPADSRIAALRLNVRSLSPRLIDLFAAKLPVMNKLSLFVGEGGRDEMGGENETPEGLRDELRKRVYLDWKLHDLGIWQSGAPVDGDLMQLLAGCIPALRSFWGQGNLSLDTT